MMHVRSISKNLPASVTALDHSQIPQSINGEKSQPAPRKEDYSMGYFNIFKTLPKHTAASLPIVMHTVWHCDFLTQLSWGLTKTYSPGKRSIQYWWKISVSTKKVLGSLSCSVASITANPLCAAAPPRLRATAKARSSEGVKARAQIHVSLVLTRCSSLDYQHCPAAALVVSFVEVSNLISLSSFDVFTLVFNGWESDIAFFSVTLLQKSATMNDYWRQLRSAGPGISHLQLRRSLYKE